MADFKTHITTSTVVGIGYGVAGVTLFDMKIKEGLLATGLCSVAGILPDLDSDSGIPVRETIALTAAVVPLLLLERFHDFGLQGESIVLAGAGMYLFIRFVVARLFKKYTVHRGMWHSVPAAAIAGLVIYLLTAYDEPPVRLYKTVAIVLGFFVHLILDEIWAIEFTHGVPRLKKSFGTAIKLWSNRGLWPNISTYGKLLVLVIVIFGDKSWMAQFRETRLEIQHTANESLDRWIHGRSPAGTDGIGGSNGTGSSDGTVVR